MKRNRSDNTTLDDFIAEMEDRAHYDSDQSEVFRNILQAGKPWFEASVQANFDSSATADGTAWAPRKEPTYSQFFAAGGYRDHKLLILSGMLMEAATGGAGHREEFVTGGSVGSAFAGEELIWGVDHGSVVYDAVQNFGWPERNIPAREYMAVSEDTVDLLAEDAADMLMELHR